MALHELKQLRCTGRADSSRAYLDLRQPPETLDALLKMRFQKRGTPCFAICSFIGVYNKGICSIITPPKTLLQPSAS